MNIEYQCVEGVEGDDVIASYTKVAKAADFEVSIISGDKDLLQLLDNKITVYNSQGIDNKETLYTKQLFADVYGFEANRFLEFKCLTGDASDGISGIPYMTKINAFELIKQFSSIEAMYDDATHAKLNKATKNVLSNAERLTLNKQLISLRDDVEVKLLADVRNKINKKDFAEYINILGFKKIQEKINLL